MRTYFSILLWVASCLAWPASADLADIQPMVQYSLPADIMQVEFAHETWVYRLYEDGTIKKVVSTRVVAARDEKVQSTDSNVSSLRANLFLGASLEKTMPPAPKTGKA